MISGTTEAERNFLERLYELSSVNKNYLFNHHVSKKETHFVEIKI